MKINTPILSNTNTKTNKNTNLRKSITSVKSKKSNVTYKKDGIIIIDKLKSENKPNENESPSKIIIKAKNW